MSNRKIIVVLGLCLALLLSGCGSRVKETKETTFGIDVARYQGTIEWPRVSRSGVDFAMVRVGYRSMNDGSIVEDPNARYNMQEVQANDIKLGVYFFSTAINEEEAREEAKWVCDLISQYAITYPVVFDCEGYQDPESRQYSLSVEERTDIALAFLKEVEKNGYEGMFYSSKNELEDGAQWDTGRIEKKYKIWVAQYPENPYPETVQSSYSGKHHMWQYTMEGAVPGIAQSVDLNVAYFGYEGIAEPKNTEPPAPAKPDPAAMMTFETVNETVTAKEATNLRDIPSQDSDSMVCYTLQNGEEATRIGISSSGWSKLMFEGNIYYAVSSYLTTDLDYTAQPIYEEETEDDGVETRFVAVNDRVTAKIEVNLRSLPSVEHPDCKVVTLLKHGQVVNRTGINEELGWSRVEYEGQVLYCVTSYLETVE